MLLLMVFNSPLDYITAQRLFDTLEGALTIFGRCLGWTQMI